MLSKCLDAFHLGQEYTWGARVRVRVQKFGVPNGGNSAKKVVHLGKRDIVDTTSHA